MKIAKKAHPHRKKITPDRAKKEQTRKGGKGTSLMHAAAKKQSAKQAADSNMSPETPASGAPTANRADHALAQLVKNRG